MRISDWSSDVCSSDLLDRCNGSGRPCHHFLPPARHRYKTGYHRPMRALQGCRTMVRVRACRVSYSVATDVADSITVFSIAPILSISQRTISPGFMKTGGLRARSEEHTSELQSLMRNSYAVFCLKKKIIKESTEMTNKEQL